MHFHCTGDAYLAYHIYRAFKSHQINPNEKIINELLTTCLKRGAIELAFGIYSELKKDGIHIPKEAIFRLYDICSVKHSMYFADVLTKDLLFNNKALYANDGGHLLNKYFKVCGVCGNLRKALEAVDQFKQRNIEINLVSINLLLRTLTTNAEMYDTQNQRQWSGVLPKNYKLYKDKLDINENPKWTKLINHSVQIVSNHQHIINQHPDNEYLLKIIDRLAFFGSRFEENKASFLMIYKYIKSNHRYLFDSSIVGHLLRGFLKHKLFSESIQLWKIYTLRSNHLDSTNDDKIVHPYIIMLRICCYNMSNHQFRSLGSGICFDLVKCNFFNEQQLFDSAFSFWSGNDETSINFLDVQEAKTMSRFMRTSQTYCSLLRCAKKNKNLQKSLQYIHDIKQCEDMQMSDNLIKSIFNTYCEFELHNESLELLRECISKYDNKYSAENGIFSVIKTFISCKKYEEILDVMMNPNSKIFEHCWIKHTLIRNDHITLLMYCCFKSINLDLALSLFEMSMDRNVTKYGIVTYNYFIQLLIAKFGQFSDIVIETVAQFIGDNVFYADYENHCGLINIYEMSSKIIPIILNCFISKFTEEDRCSFHVICCRNLKSMKPIRRDKYRLLSGEDSDYLLSVAHYHLQNDYYPPIECKWTLGGDEIKCDSSAFVRAFKLTNPS